MSILKRLKLPEAELWTLTQIKRSRYLYTHPNPIICGPFEGLTEAKEAHIAAFPAAAAQGTSTATPGKAPYRPVHATGKASGSKRKKVVSENMYRPDGSHRLLTDTEYPGVYRHPDTGDLVATVVSNPPACVTAGCGNPMEAMQESDGSDGDEEGVRYTTPGSPFFILIPHCEDCQRMMAGAAKEAHMAAVPAAAAAALSDRELEVFARDCDAFLGAKP